MDQILISGLEVNTKIGCSEEERLKSQNISINVILEVDGEKASKSKELKDSVCYLTVSNQIKELVEKKEWVLLEELAYEISNLCIRDFPLVLSTQTEVKKYVIPFTDYTSFKTRKIERN